MRAFYLPAKIMEAPEKQDKREYMEPLPALYAHFALIPDETDNPAEQYSRQRTLFRFLSSMQGLHLQQFLQKIMI